MSKIKLKPEQKLNLICRIAGNIYGSVICLDPDDKEEEVVERSMLIYEKVKEKMEGKNE